MPELPEVETIRSGLQKYIVGYTIEAIEVRLPRRFFGDPYTLVGAEVKGIRRFGKGLVIDFSNQYSLAIHVKMTGQLLFRNEGEKVEGWELPDKHTHVIFELKIKSEKLKVNKNFKMIPSPLRGEGQGEGEKGAYLYYRDMRKFGWLQVIETEKVFDFPFFKALGVEPLTELPLKAFTDMLMKSKTPIKLFLLDQTKIAGIGNIYANDSLFQAGIHPTRPANSLTQKEVRKLHGAIIEILQKSIAVGGASASNYINVLGEKGSYQDHFLVYKKDGQACKVCGSLLKSMRLGGRGTFYCPKCQK